VPSVSVAAVVMPRIAAKGRRRARVLATLPAASVHALTLRSSGTGLQRASPASSQPLSYDVSRQAWYQHTHAHLSDQMPARPDVRLAGVLNSCCGVAPHPSRR